MHMIGRHGQYVVEHPPCAASGRKFSVPAGAGSRRPGTGRWIHAQALPKSNGMQDTIGFIGCGQVGGDGMVVGGGHGPVLLRRLAGGCAGGWSV